MVDSAGVEREGGREEAALVDRVWWWGCCCRAAGQGEKGTDSLTGTEQVKEKERLPLATHLLESSDTESELSVVSR